MGQCPSGFIPHGGACVRGCSPPFQFLSENSQPRCVYTGDLSKFVTLTPLAAIIPEPGKPLPALQDLEKTDPLRYSAYQQENQRVEGEIATLLKTIDKNKQLDDAFRRLQDAENVRDKAPEAYQVARVAYYTLAKGPEWVEDEKTRIAKTEADPEVQRYITAYQDVTERQTSQQGTQDVMRSVKDGVLSLKDDVQYTTKTFQDQIAKLKNQINIERRGRVQADNEETPFFKWLDTILNLLIVAGLIVAVLTVWRKMSTSAAYAPSALSL